MEKELEEWYELHRVHFYMGSYQTKELANYLEVSPRTIQRWLKGKGKPSTEQLAQIKRYLASLESKLEESV
jgi:transcriptional regulator with XRE-family HTH domain